MTELNKEEHPTEKSSSKKRDLLIKEYLEQIFNPDHFDSETLKRRATEILKALLSGIITFELDDIPGLTFPPGVILGAMIESASYIYPAIIIPSNISNKLKSGEKPAYVPYPGNVMIWGMAMQQRIKEIPPEKRSSVQNLDPSDIKLLTTQNPDGSRNLNLYFLRIYPPEK